MTSGNVMPSGSPTRVPRGIEAIETRDRRTPWLMQEAPCRGGWSEARQHTQSLVTRWKLSYHPDLREGRMMSTAGGRRMAMDMAAAGANRSSPVMSPCVQAFHLTWEIEGP